MEHSNDIDRLHREVATRMGSPDPAHDYQHVLRVEQNALRIAANEGADTSVVRLSALLHELFNYPKNHPESHRSGEVCAEHASAILKEHGFGAPICDAVQYAIRVHGYSAGVVPTTLEAKILQDADRLDAIGAIGIARCFATCASMQRPFYNPADPFCDAREPRDKEWGIDHFYQKLLLIPDRLHTDTAHALARERVVFMRSYLAQLRTEIGSITP